MITLNDLYELCRQQIANGNGDKKVILHSGSVSGYSELRSGFMSADAVFGDEYGEFCTYNIPSAIREQPLSDFVVLG